MQEWREKSLCYTSEKLFMPGHKSKYLLQAEGNELEVVVLLQAMLWKRVGNIMKVLDQLPHLKAFVLIDCNNMHNFITPPLFHWRSSWHFCGWPFSVLVGRWPPTPVWVLSNIYMEIQGFHFCTNLWLLLIEG